MESNKLDKPHTNEGKGNTWYKLPSTGW